MDGLTVAVPTRDRQGRLPGALEAIASELGREDELLVVDNGSTDRTGAAAEAFLGDMPGGRLVSEPAGGISAARNRALREARNPVVCFVDDDVRVQPGWLSALRSAWSGSTPNVACIGGPLLPDWQAPRPAWLADYLLYVISALDLGDERRRLDQTLRVGYAWGGNMSIRAEPALALGGFREDGGCRACPVAEPEPLAVEPVLELGRGAGQPSGGVEPGVAGEGQRVEWRGRALLEQLAEEAARPAAPPGQPCGHGPGDENDAPRRTDDRSGHGGQCAGLPAPWEGRDHLGA